MVLTQRVEHHLVHADRAAGQDKPAGAPGVAYSYFVKAASPAGTSLFTAAVTGRQGALIIQPTITTQPESQTVSVGASVTFSVVASGTAPLSYQWRKDNINIPGANGPSHTISPVSAADEGFYSVPVAETVKVAEPPSRTV